MIDWKVLDDVPLPEGDGDEPQPRRVRWRWVALGAVALAGALGLWRVAQVREARLRADVTQAVIQEERALRFGVAEQARELADPAAPPDWRLRYEALFHQPPADDEPPEVVAIEPDADAGLALVTLAHEGDGEAWQSVRAYRLVGTRWRRTPVTPELWGTPTLHSSPHFSLWLSERDATALPPDELLAFLETFNEAFRAAWPSPALDAPGYTGAGVSIEPNEWTSPTHINMGHIQLVAGSPLLAAPSATTSLAPDRAYRLALAQELALALDMGEASEEVEQRALRATLRDAVVRHLVLTPAERARFRDALDVDELTLEVGRTTIERSNRLTMIFLADYLIALEGLDAPGRLVEAMAQSHNLEAATIHAFGIPLPFLLEEVRVWMRGVPTPQGSGAPPRATVLRVTGDQPFEAMTVLHETGELAPLLARGGDRLPLSAGCLGAGTVLSFEPPPDAPLEAEQLQVETLRLARLRAEPMPDGSEVVVARQQNGATRLVALDGAGHETELMSLPDTATLAPHPTEPYVAFLLADVCGTSVIVANLATGETTRVPVALEGTGHLLWSEQLYVVDDAAHLDPPHWTVTEVVSRGTPLTALRPLRAAQGWEDLIGTNRDTGRHLLRLEDGTLRWLDVTRWFNMLGVTLPPFEPPLPPDATPRALSPDGRWLAYTLRDTELHVLDLETGSDLILHRLSEGTFGEMRFRPSEPPLLATVVNLRVNTVDGSVVHLFSIAGSGSFVQTFPPDSLVSGIQWCNDGRLLYHLARGDERVLAVSDLAVTPPRDLSADGQVLVCASGAMAGR